MSKASVHDVIFEAEGVSEGGMRNDITVHWPQMKTSWELATDEPPSLGGNASAPPPLAYILAGLAGCLMTNLRMMARHHAVEIHHLRVQARAEWERHVAPGAPHVAGTRGFFLDVTIDSDAEDETLVELLRTAQAGCFVEHSLVEPAAVSHRLKLGHEWRAV